jgi:TRAP-type C4-dicarboxylate transport system substrate-binding protein
VQKYLSNTGHFFDFIAIVANRRQFQALKPEQQQAVRKAMTDAIAYQRKLAIELDEKALQQLTKKMQFDRLSPAALAEMRKATAPVVDQVKKRAGAELVDRVVAEAGKAQ